MKVILASKSPRRRELLSELLPKFDIVSADVDETFSADIHPKDGVVLLAERKGEVAASLMGGSYVVISSDTLVEIDGDPLGKPLDEDEAFSILRRLSGRVHRVHTGVAVHYRGRVMSGVSTTFVKFHELTDTQIREYIATGEPMDKAGAYGIQGKGAALVEGYNGDYDTVVGLSLSLTARLLTEITGGEILSEMKRTYD